MINSNAHRNFRLKCLSNNDIFELKSGSALIGRNQFNDIFIDSELLSRQHASIHVEGEGVIIEDLGSKNGTLVNDMPIVDKTRLMPGDVITVGDEKLMLIAPDQHDGATVFSLNMGGNLSGAAQSKPGVGSQATAIKSGAIVVDKPLSAAEFSKEVYADQMARLISASARAGLISVDAKEALPLVDAKPGANQWNVGREKFIEVKVEHPTISNHHATIRSEDGAWTIKDEASTNGTKVNGQRCVESALCHGDGVSLGKVNYWFVVL